MNKIYNKITFIVFFIYILSKNKIKSNQIINKNSKNIINLNNNESIKPIENTKFNIMLYINKINLNKNFKLRNTGLLDILEGTVDGLLDVVDTTVDGLLDTLLGEEINDIPKENTNTNNNNENKDSNDNNNNNENENENNDLNNNNNEDSDSNNKDTIIDNNKKDENNSVKENSEPKQNNKEKIKVTITDTSITIKGKLLSNIPTEAYKIVSSNSLKFKVENKIVNLITDNYSLYIYDTSIQPNKTNKESFLDLSSCEKELRSHYKIPENENLIIIKMDTKTNDNNPTNKVTFSVYTQSGKELDTNICSKITIEIPIKEDTDLNISKIVIMQNNGIDLTDKGDPFFNDICIPYDNDDSNGMPFDKRTTLYVNESFCDSNCDLDSIENLNESYVAICNCGKSYAEKAEKKRQKNFIKSVFNSNIFVIRCFKISFEWKRLKNNLGHWVFYIFNVGQIINLGFFLGYGLKSLNNLVSLPKSSSPIQRKNILNNNLIYENNIFKKDKSINSENDFLNHLRFNSQSTVKEYSETNEVINPGIKVSRFSCISPSTQNLNESENIYTNHDTINQKDKIDTEKNSISEKIKIEKKTNKEEEEININTITEDQLESFPYEKAVKYDNRNFGKTYLYSISHKQSLLNAIFIDTKSKLRTIKFATIIIGITLNFGWNAFFFSQSMQNRRYEGDNSIWIRIPKVILACFSSIVCCIILNLISSYDKELNEISKKENLKKNEIDKFIKKVKCRLISFYCLLFFFSLFFWYFCTSYCAVYPKYAKPWLNDSLQSLFLAQFSPFIFCVLYVGLRLIGIKCELKAFFFISKFLNIFLDTRYKKFLKLC